MTHESYGSIILTKPINSFEKTLFGSSIKHADTIILRICNAEYERQLSYDSYYPKKELIEVEMSTAQFAELITSIGKGEGTPCTIRAIDSKRIEPCPFIPKGQTHHDEFVEHQQDIKEKLSDFSKNLKTLLEKKTLNKSDKEQILKSLQNLSTDITVNSAYQVAMFEEQMAKTVHEAKLEIESIITHHPETITNISSTRLLSSNNNNEIKE